MFLRYCLSDFEMVPVAPIITGITVAFTIHIHWISITSSLYYKNLLIFFINHVSVSRNSNIY
jgi:hypothetical protein